MSKRRTHSPEFKARVAMEAISGRKTIQEIAADHAIHPIQVSQWKRQLLDGASELLTRGKLTTDKEEGQAKEAELFQQIGGCRWSWSGSKRISAALMPATYASWSIVAIPNSATAGSVRSWAASIHALLPTHTGAGLNAADHGQDRCSLPGGSVQREPPDGSTDSC